jgi:hypothetical protein
MHLDIDGTRYPLSNDMADFAWDKDTPCCPRCHELLEFDNDTRIDAHWHDDYTIACPCGWEGRLTV